MPIKIQKIQRNSVFLIGKDLKFRKIISKFVDILTEIDRLVKKFNRFNHLGS